MAKAKTLVGLDVHATKMDAAAFCAGLPRPVRAAYEAGPTGYGLARELAKRRVECVVAAPSKIPRASGDRVKTDRRDAELLARLLLAGKLHAVRVPGAEEEALRDLVRAREQVRVDLMRCRHRLSKLLLRHGIRFWFASESMTQIGVLITHHLRGFRHDEEGVFDDRAGTFAGQQRGWSTQAVSLA